MDNNQKEVLNIFMETGALLTGHFVLRSGRHSGHYFQCARVCEHMDHVQRLAGLLLEKLDLANFQTVLSPAMGGLVIGQEVARQAGKRYMFAEKIEDILSLRRGFKLAAGEKVLVVEDVITRGGRATEALEIIRRHGGEAMGVAILVDRSEGAARFKVPLTSLLQLSFPTYPADALPDELKALPTEKPGS